MLLSPPASLFTLLTTTSYLFLQERRLICLFTIENDAEDAKFFLKQLRQRVTSLEETVARLNGVETENTQLKQRTVELEELVAGLNGVRVQLQDKTAEADGLMQRVAELEQEVMQLRAQEAQTQATNASDRNDEMEM